MHACDVCSDCTLWSIARAVTRDECFGIEDLMSGAGPCETDGCKPSSLPTI